MYVFKRKALNLYFCVKNVHLVYTNNLKKYQQQTLTGTDHCNSKLFKGIRFDRNRYSVFLMFQKICKKIFKEVIFLVYWYIWLSGIFLAFKSKLQIIHVATYIALCFFLTPKAVLYIFIIIISCLHL